MTFMNDMELLMAPLDNPHNGPQYSADQYERFSKEWDFKCGTSSYQQK